MKGETREVGQLISDSQGETSSQRSNGSSLQRQVKLGRSTAGRKEGHGKALELARAGTLVGYNRGLPSSLRHMDALESLLWVISWLALASCICIC